MSTWFFPEDTVKQGATGWQSATSTMSPRTNTLTKEAIQNVVDAFNLWEDKPGDAEPAVHFEVREIQSNKIPGREELQSHLESCHKMQEDSDKSEYKDVKKALETIEKSKIKVLQVKDFNTYGLRGDPKDPKGTLHKLWKADGDGSKQNAAGSWGKGKTAPFLHTRPRTIFYSTKYKLKNKDAWIERAVGKALLRGHKGEAEGKYYLNEGYYPSADKVLCGDEIPDWLRHTDPDGDGGHGHRPGSMLSLIGYKYDDKWMNQITVGAILTFFSAIFKDGLVITLKEGEKQEILSKDTLKDLVESRGQEFKEAAQKDECAHEWRVLLQLLRIYDPMEKKNLEEKVLDVKHLGKVTLTILPDEEIKRSSLAIIRHGMLINVSTSMDKLQPIKPNRNAWKQFVGILEFDSEGDDFFVQGENPGHDDISTKHVPEDDRKGYEEAIKDLVDKVEAFFESKFQKYNDSSDGEFVLTDALHYEEMSPGGSRESLGNGETNIVDGDGDGDGDGESTGNKKSIKIEKAMFFVLDGVHTVKLTPDEDSTSAHLRIRSNGSHSKYPIIIEQYDSHNGQLAKDKKGIRNLKLNKGIRLEIGGIKLPEEYQNTSLEFEIYEKST